MVGLFVEAGFATDAFAAADSDLEVFTLFAGAETPVFVGWSL